MTVKAAIVFKRKPGMDLDAFRSYWLEEHPKAVLKMPGLVRYCQNHPLPGGYRKGELACDGVAETWWEDMETLRRNAALPEFEALCEDEARFIDRANMAVLLVEEHVIVDGERPAGGVKNIELIHRKPGMEVGAFQDYWRGTHGPIAAGIAQIRRYVQNHVRPGAYRDGRQPALDGLAITWFDDTDAMRASAASEAYATTRADEAAFIDESRLAFVVTKEHVIKG